ncbi:hypothetical protein [Flavobacterium tistrianum]|uniref:hypothetical protein n=1 Tax=Flavobacterium tistrianum TaxID=1685414 RepID=UPI000DAE247B|nr:hypothetical protein [Flavobacterium tistrianum]KAF2339854.1 hypothetical protein DMB71_15430 [Flavobacterium tistrianum]
MKVKLFTTISFLTYQFSISQTDKLLHGKVVSQNLILKNVEVINKTAKTSTTTNASGEFTIVVKAQDSLLFFAKNYFFTRLKISADNLKTNNLVVNMIPEAEELDNVVVTQMKSIKLVDDADNREAIAEIKKQQSYNDLNQRYLNINDGRIKNGINFKRAIFDGPEKKIELRDDRFKKLATAYCPPDFFIKNLKIKPEEKEIFLDFCNADSKSKTLLEQPNVLSIMDFLYAKNEEFKNLK